MKRKQFKLIGGRVCFFFSAQPFGKEKRKITQWISCFYFEFNFKRYCTFILNCIDAVVIWYAKQVFRRARAHISTHILASTENSSKPFSISMGGNLKMKKETVNKTEKQYSIFVYGIAQFTWIIGLWNEAKTILLYEKQTTNNKTHIHTKKIVERRKKKLAYAHIASNFYSIFTTWGFYIMLFMFTGHSIASDRSISLCVWPSTIGWWVADLWFNLIVDEVKMSEDESQPQSMQLTAVCILCKAQ